MKATAVLFLAALTIHPLSAAAQDPVKAPPIGKSAFRAEFLSNVEETQKKITDLAKAVPAEKYSWRPAPGVRSISEVYMHIAGGNYFLATFLGVQPPASIPKDLEMITDKARVLVELQKSFDHVRAIANRTSDADFEKKVTLFANETTERNVFVTMLNHLHEHLGQSIAYARMNGVVPPWSQ